MSNLVLDVHTADGKTDGTVELPAEIFDAPANISLMHQVVIAQQVAGHFFSSGVSSSTSATSRSRARSVTSSASRSVSCCSRAR